MDKDFAQRQVKKQSNKEAATMAYCFWLIVGMVIGSGATFSFLYTRQNKHNPIQVVQKETKPDVQKPKTHNDLRAPHFDFYTMLPNMEVTVASAPTLTTPTHVHKAKQASVTPASGRHTSINPPSDKQYFLQVGAFNKKTDAQTLKVQLMIMGFHATIQTAHKEDNKVVNRVWVGPYTEISQAKLNQKKLDDKHFNSILLSLPFGQT